MILLKTFLVIGIIFHCGLLTAAEAKKENISENLADYGIYPRSMYGALPQPKPQQPIYQSIPPPISPPNQCTSCCAISMNSVSQAPIIIIPCGYTHTPGVGIHKYHPETKSWNDARLACINEGGHLAVINSVEEQNLFSKISVESEIADEAWIGLHDLFKQFEWTTVLDVPINNIGFINWAPGEPNNTANDERCVTFQTSKNGMNDRNCGDAPRPFFCEISMP